jgi:formiminoglutamase
VGCLPLLLSIPHAGLRVPDEVRARSLLTLEEIVADGDEGAADIYLPLRAGVAASVTTEIARAFVDMNRARDDIRKDGVVKTHTCWDVPIYDGPLDEAVTAALLDAYWAPYHARLVELSADVRLGVDAHTMAACGPPVGPDAGVERPAVCLGNANGKTCPDAWLRTLADALRDTLDVDVACNAPFAGGYITRSQPGGIPWIQIELSRAPFATNVAKTAGVRHALAALCATL